MERATGRRSSSRWRRYLSALGDVVAVLLLCTAGLVIVDLRSEAVGDYRRDMRNLGVVLAEQKSRSVQALGLGVQETREKIMASAIRTPEQFKRAVAGEEFHRFLRSQLKSIPQSDAVIIFGADGKVENYSRNWPVAATDVTDRDYFIALRDRADLGLFISVPVL